MQNENNSGRKASNRYGGVHVSPFSRHPVGLCFAPAATKSGSGTNGLVKSVNHLK